MGKASKAPVVSEPSASEPKAPEPTTEASEPSASEPAAKAPSALVLVRILSRLKHGGKRIEPGEEAILSRDLGEDLAARGIVELLEG